jgi:hypothetical protein
MLTPGEKKVLRIILTSFGTEYSINNIANESNLSPNGAYKILKKFEKEGILLPKKIANIVSYKINFDNEKTPLVLELALIPDLNKRIQNRADDLRKLKPIALSCIFFGSYLSKVDPDDLDVLFVLDKINYEKYTHEIIKAKEIIPVALHDIVQTKEDIKNNIIKKDKIVLDILRNGVIIWGQDLLIQVIRDLNTWQT